MDLKSATKKFFLIEIKILFTNNIKNESHSAAMGYILASSYLF